MAHCLQPQAGNRIGAYQRAAWIFAQYICSPEAKKVYVGLDGASPVQTLDVKDVFLRLTPPKNNQYFLESLTQDYAKLLPLNPHWPDMETKADSAL